MLSGLNGLTRDGQVKKNNEITAARKEQKNG
jgi:hypothetical protein